MQSQTSHVDRVNPPLLSIAYIHTKAPSLTSLTFHVVYFSEANGLRSSAIALLVTDCILEDCRVLLHTSAWRNPRNEEMRSTAWHSLLQLLMSLLTNGALTLFVALLYSVHSLLFFMFQSTVVVLLPSVDHRTVLSHEDAYRPGESCCLLPSFHLVVVLYWIHRQLYSQLVFINWEKQRAQFLLSDSVSQKPHQ